MFKLIGTLAGAAALGAVGYLGYKRFFGTTEQSCALDTPWYLPTPKYDCGQNTENGEIDGRYWYQGQWAYHFKNGKQALESAMHPVGQQSYVPGQEGWAECAKRGQLCGAAVQIL